MAESICHGLHFAKIKAASAINPLPALISLTNPAIIVLDFGSDKVVSSGSFTVVFPTFDATNAIIRIA